MKAIPYGRQNITQEDIDAVIDVLKSDFLTQGPKIHEFESKFAEYVGAKYAVAVANGTAALHLCALALDVNNDSKVITTPITFAASANCIRYAGGQVEFADINEETFLLDSDKVRKLLESSPKGTYSGLIPVDFAGYPVDLQAFRQLADEFGLWIIEDACHAPGAYFSDSSGNKQYCGNGQYADLAIFSFHPVKHIATGEGGMITTNNKALYDKLAVLRTHGITKDPNALVENHGGWYYEMQTLGYNYRLTDFQAALGVSQLKRANEGFSRRNEIADRYTAGLKNLPLTLQKVENGVGHAYHLYVIQSDRRLELYNFLHKNNVKAQVHYIPVHLMPYYRNLGWKKGDFPVSEAFYEKCISLPMYPTLTVDEQDYIIQQLKTFFGIN